MVGISYCGPWEAGPYFGSGPTTWAAAFCFRRRIKKNIKPAIAITAAPPTPTPTPIGTALLLLFSEDGVSVGVVPPVSPGDVPVSFSFSIVVDGAVVVVEGVVEGVVVVEALVVDVVEVVFVLEMDVIPRSIVVTMLPASAVTIWEELLQSHPPRP